MFKQILLAKRILIILAVFAFIGQAAIVHANLEVQVINQNGNKAYVVTPRAEEQAEGPDQAAVFVKRYSPNFIYYYDFSNPADSVPDFFVCGENQTSGQITCKTMDTTAGTIISTINFFDPSYNMPPSNTYIADINGDGIYDVMACGIKTSDNSVACQTKQITTGANIGVGIFTAIPATEGMYYPDGYRWSFVETNNDNSSKEMAFCYRKSATQQINCRVVNIMTGVLVSTIPILNKNYDVSTWTPYFYDRNSDGIYEVVSCARNHVTGQYMCEMRNSATGALIKNIPIMTTTDFMNTSSYWYNYDPSTPETEFMGCGWSMTTKQPKCEIKRQNNTIFKSFNILGPAFIP